MFLRPNVVGFLLCLPAAQALAQNCLYDGKQYSDGAYLLAGEKCMRCDKGRWVDRDIQYCKQHEAEFADFLHLAATLGLSAPGVASVAEPPQADASKTPALLAAVTPPASLPPPDVAISDVFHSADGCRSTAQHFSIGIPHHERLDLTYAGVVSGIEFRESTKVAESGYRNVSFSGGTLAFDLFANGQGTTQCCCWPIQRCVCLGAGGASVGYKIVAHYQRPAPAPKPSGTRTKRRP